MIGFLSCLWILGTFFLFSLSALTVECDHACIGTACNCTKPMIDNAHILSFPNSTALANETVHRPQSKIARFRKKGLNNFKSIGDVSGQLMVLSRTGKTTDAGDVSNRAGLFTPYGITPGGGEKYFLTAALAFQTMGYEVDILVKSTNVCDEIWKLEATAASVRVPLNFDRLRMIQLFSKSTARSLKYEAFFAMGNSKFPVSYAIGSKINVWMCQFPFDLDRPPYSSTKSANLKDFDVTYVNSRYSQGWYAHYIEPYIVEKMNASASFPALKILYPPVNPLNVTPGDMNRSYTDDDEVFNIVVLGRFFRGRQSKGHDVALNALEAVVQQSDRKFHLSLIGHIHPNEESLQYVSDLRRIALSKNLPVTFITNARPDEVKIVLSSAKAMWHLTGMRKDENENDPASKEHFGIAIVEAMSVGCIPIVTAIGGPSDIVIHGISGYLASSLEDYVNYTIAMAAYPKKRLKNMSKAAIERAELFTLESFVSRFGLLAHKALLSRDFRSFVFKNLPVLQSIGSKVASKSRKLSVVMIEIDLNPLFEFTARNVMNFLGPSWALQVFCLERNMNLTRYALRDFQNVYFRPLPLNITSPLDYNRLLKMSSFWHSLGAEKALLVQSDSLMLTGGIERFIHYDIIGTMPNPAHISVQNRTYSFHEIAGHAGFSLRTVKAMIEICDLHAAQSPSIEHEDSFFTRHLKAMHYKVADAATTEIFCPNTQILFRAQSTWQSQMPIALHAPWYYNRPDELLYVYEMGWLFSVEDSFVAAIRDILTEVAISNYL